MRFGRNDTAEYHEAKHCHHGARTIYYMSLWDEFETPWMFIHRGVIPPGAGIGHHFHDNCEEMYVILDNAARFVHNGNAADMTAGAMVPCYAGDSHGLYNHTDSDTQFINLGVGDVDGRYDNRDLEDNLEGAVPGSTDMLPSDYIDRDRLTLAGGAVHGGKGQLKFRRIWSHEPFRTNWGFIDHILLPPDSSIGYHRHETIEECYIILSGKGRITVDDETMEVFTGDAIPSRLGGCHGIYNDSQAQLEVLNMAVSLEKGKFDSEDLGDDLSDRV